MRTTRDERLLDVHRQHLGLYARVAKTFGVSHSYVSLVASGKRRSKKIMGELLKELRKMR